MSPYFVYILRCSDKRESLYTGYTTNLKRRLQEHQKGKGSKFTRGRRPVELVFKERFSTRMEAVEREMKIKSMTRAQKVSLVNDKSKE